MDKTCKTCGQTDAGQTGEYPCPQCGLPTAHDAAPAMKKITVEVTQTTTVDVEVDEAEFNEEFMQEFRRSFYQFDNIEEHAKHLAQLTARGMAGCEFVEGYGHINGSKPSGNEPKMNITTRTVDSEIECYIW